MLEPYKPVHRNGIEKYTRPNQTEDKSSDPRSPSKGSSASLKLSKKGRQKRGTNVMPDDIHVIGNLVCSRHNYFALKGRKDTTK